MRARSWSEASTRSRPTHTGVPLDVGQRANLVEPVEQVADPGVGRPTSRSASVPPAGLESSAMTRSLRYSARASPSSAATVVLPTPPFSDTTAIW